MRQHRELSEINARILKFAQDDLAKIMARLPAGDPAAARDLLLEVIPALVGRHTETAGEAAAQWYEREYLQAFGTAGKGRIVGADEGAVRGSVRWAVGPLFDDHPDPEAARQRLASMVDRHVNDASRQTIVASALADKREARWARVMSGAETCGWCRMLASRGFVYHTSESAGADHAWGHDHCDCQVVPDFSLTDDELTSYNQRVEELRAEYQDVVSRMDGPVTGATVAAEWRKSLIDFDLEERRLGKQRDRFTADGTINLDTWDNYRRQLLDQLRSEYPGGYTWGKHLPPRNPSTAPTDWPEDLPPLRTKEWNHALYGDRTGGGHAAGFGWVHDRPEFAGRHDPEWLRGAAEQILRTNGDLTGDAQRFDGVVDGVRMAVVLGGPRSARRVVTIFPVTE